MKLVTLNILRGGGKRAPAIVDYLLSLSADVLVLTEFIGNSSGELIRSKLAAAGFGHFATASDEPNENSVCILSRDAFVSRRFPNLNPADRHRLISAHFEGLSVYGVYFAQRKEKATLFEFLSQGGHGQSENACFIIGDFNTGLHHKDEKGATFICTAELKSMIESGLVDSWRSRNPDQVEYSWFSNVGNGFRIDQVFSNAPADAMIESVCYDHLPRTTKLSDHSALIVETSP